MRPITTTMFAALVLALASPPADAASAINTQQFMDRFMGVNLHLNGCCNGRYSNTQQVIDELKYIRATHLRDGPIPMGGLLDRYKMVSSATGAKFEAVIETGSPARQRACLDVIKSWFKTTPGLLTGIEGTNEPDTAPAIQAGASLANSAAFQTEVYYAGKAAGVPVTQLSVGAGWFAPLWEGNYKSFGKPPADYGNAHVYMNKGETPSVSLKRIGELAQWSVNGKATNVTEFGMFKGSQFSADLTSAYMHIGPFSSYLFGHYKLSVYALHDDSTNTVGFYDFNNQPRAHARYWHIMGRLLADPAGRNLPKKDINVTFTNVKSVGKNPLTGIKNVVMYKSNGAVWVAAYDEEKPGALDGSQTVVFDRTYPYLQVVDGRTGAVVQTLENSRQISLRLPANHVHFVVASSYKLTIKF